MTTTTYIFPNKQSTRTPVFLRNYGSMGRHGSGRRKSAVELLQETKAFYVKSESVLDTKQNLKNTDHLHVRSPTVDVQHYRSGNPEPFFPIGTCPPYVHHHFDPYDVQHVHLQREFEHFVQQHVNNKDRKVSTYTINESNTLPLPFPYERNNKISRSISNNTVGSRDQKTVSISTSLNPPPPRRSTLPPPPPALQSSKTDVNVSNVAISSNNIIGLPLPLPFSAASQKISSSSTAPRSVNVSGSGGGIEKHVSSSTLPVITSSSTLPNHGDNPPALPPKSPRTTTTVTTTTTSKPIRPQDFPQRLPVQNTIPPDIQSIQPPPRRSSQNDHHQEGNIHSKLRRLYDGSGGISNVSNNSHPNGLGSNNGVNGVGNNTIGADQTALVTLLSPTYSPENIASPMSDSGNFPIISPPPAFSTPVTPNLTLNRQNSSASEKSSQKHHPLSAAMSMVSVSISSISSTRKSIPDLSASDISMRYSPKSSSASPMSPDDADGEDEDESSSSTEAKAPPKASKLSNSSNLKKPKIVPIIPKSVTENALSKFSNVDSSAPPRKSSHSNEVSPIRKPILRSKSDLSHRYIKSGSSSNLLSGGFTLVHIPNHDLPPPPPHQNLQHNKPSYNTYHHHHHHNNKQPHHSEEILISNSSILGKQRNSKSSLELERFFDKLGLDNNTPPPTLKLKPGDRSGGSSPVFFSSVSSVDSGPRRFGSIDSGDSPLGVKIGSRTVGHCTSNSTTNIVVQHGEPSIVERNARVIKWLYSCRKSQVEKR